MREGNVRHREDNSHLCHSRLNEGPRVLRGHISVAAGELEVLWRIKAGDCLKMAAFSSAVWGVWRGALATLAWVVLLSRMQSFAL